MAGSINARPHLAALAIVAPGATATDYHQVDVARTLQGLPAKDYAAIIKIRDFFVFGHGTSIQPDIHYITRPAAAGDIDNALTLVPESPSSSDRPSTGA